eukprot:CAMPEP_0178937622 /NCGR_PEP_ID=MMETSP0786-20121207/25873_1 /TAXON_ID=186022 /ORGANISM="Thalassionema frauenfeldii, Strain CCMP 1798" /LENGTH=646 /DNA_ID=CAMNT_0020616241 /DNA_START=159 /DNA_END=2099 /DNA_ORIENTATION=+
MSSSTTSTPSTPEMALRQLFDQHNLDCYIVPSDDPHLSEYTPEAYKRRQFITEFGGSAGTALIFREQAKLWTDSRYYNEANLQLDGDHWDLMKQGLPETPTISNYIADAAKEHYESYKKPFRIGMDPFVHAASFCKELEKALDEKIDNEDDKCGILETSLTNNLIDELWGESRPALPNAPFRVHEHAGKTVAEKVKAVREQMAEKKATMAVFSALDDVAYLFNIRAQGDIDTCPVGMAYGVITNDQVMLLCDKEKVANIQEYLNEAGITVKPYDAVLDQIKEHLETTDENTKRPKIWIDTTRSNYAIRSLIQEDKQLLDCQTAVTTMKACKNAVEMEGMKRAHVVDGAAMAHFISWLQEQISSGKKVSEVEIDVVLRNYRSQQPGYIEDSFPTIAGVGSNGAIIHYRAKEDSDLMKYLDAESSILIDSGGQYTYGTTDVTRTWHFGEKISPEFKQYYTRVLKGNIAMDSMIFPTNTPGFVLDVFARKSLWDAQLDYGHGTGHGVGAALNVHEGPQSISPRWGNKEFLKKGMVVSNEPGYYEDGNFGIRIENLLEITYVNNDDNLAYDQEKELSVKPSGKKTFLKFQKLTMIPIQKNLIDLELMSSTELDWLDAYHQEVWEKVSPLLEEGSSAYQWLQRSCDKIKRT